MCWRIRDRGWSGGGARHRVGVPVPPAPRRTMAPAPWPPQECTIDRRGATPAGRRRRAARRRSRCEPALPPPVGRSGNASAVSRACRSRSTAELRRLPLMERQGRPDEQADASCADIAELAAATGAVPSERIVVARVNACRRCTVQNTTSTAVNEHSMARPVRMP